MPVNKVKINTTSSTRSGATQMHSFTQLLSLGFSVGFSFNHAQFCISDFVCHWKKRQGRRFRWRLKKGFWGWGALHAGGQFDVIDGTQLEGGGMRTLVWEVSERIALE